MARFVDANGFQYDPHNYDNPYGMYGNPYGQSAVGNSPANQDPRATRDSRGFTQTNFDPRYYTPPAEPNAQNANTLLGMFNFGGSGLTADQTKALEASGYDTGAGAINQWQQDVRNNGGLTWDNQVPLVSQILNEGRYREALGLNTLQSQLAQSQLNETGAYMANNRDSRFGEMVGTDQAYSQGMNDVMKSFDTARNELDMAGQGAVTGLLSRERQQVAGAQQNLSRQGLGSSSVLANARQGIQSQTGRDIAGVQEQVGGMRSSVAQQRAGAQQSMYGTQANLRADNTRSRMALDAGQADFMNRRNQTESGILGNRINLIQSMNDQAKGNASQTNESSNDGLSQVLGFASVAAPIVAALV